MGSGISTSEVSSGGGWRKNALVFLTTIAVLLGTGILGLPITLVNTGFYPFLTLFTLTFALQIAIVFVHADTLQRAQKHMHQRLLVERGGSATPPQPDLHTMGKLYLTPHASLLFDAAILITFVATLISYALAGASSFSSLLGTSVTALIVPFVGVCTAVIIFASGVIQPVISVLTFVKVLLLTFIIGTCSVVAGAVHNNFHDSWVDVMSPFLVGTVAIGGIADMMPVFFTYTNPTRKDIEHFRWSIIAGITACFILNVVWARAVLGIVPQTIADAAAVGSDVSLEAAGNAGDIATKPVIAVIKERFSQYGWVATTVTAFITLSITVSFNAVGLGIKHVLDGMAVTLLRGMSKALDLHPREVSQLAEAMASAGGDGGHGGGGGFTLSSLNPMAGLASVVTAASTAAGRALLTTRAALYIGTFGTVMGIALADPSGFITVLEVFVSMALNLGGGALVVMMYVGVRSPPRGSLHRAAMRMGGHRVLAAHTLAKHVADDAAAAASPNDADDDAFSTSFAAGRGGADNESSRPLTGGEHHRAKAAGAAGGVGGSDHSAEDGDDDDSIALPLSEGPGAALAIFCLLCFATAVIYDIYSAGINKKVYGVPTGAWIAACATIMFWRHMFVPVLRWLRSGAIAHDAAASGGPQQQSSLPLPRPRLQFVYLEASDEDEEEEEERGVHSGRPSLCGRALRVVSGFNFADEVMDLGVCLSAAWSATHEGCDENSPVMLPLGTVLSGTILTLHLLLTPVLRSSFKARAQSFRLGLCVLASVLLGGLALINGLCGATGPAAVQGALLAYTLWATWYRVARRSPTDPLVSL